MLRSFFTRCSSMDLRNSSSDEFGGKAAPASASSIAVTSDGAASTEDTSPEAAGSAGAWGTTPVRPSFLFRLLLPDGGPLAMDSPREEAVRTFGLLGDAARGEEGTVAVGRTPLFPLALTENAPAPAGAEAVASRGSRMERRRGIGGSSMFVALLR